MHKTIGWAALIALAGACDGDGDALEQEQGMATPIPPTPELDESWSHDRWASCADQLDCLSFEHCLRGTLAPFNLCTAYCNGADDCRGPNTPAQTALPANVTCTELEGSRRCIMSCLTDEDCGSGMTCFGAACVWPEPSDFEPDNNLDGEAGQRAADDA